MSSTRIAILIPVFNEEPVITGTIKALAEAGISLNDVHVVDDRSTDHTVKILGELGIKTFTVPVNGGKALAQIAALEHFKILTEYDWVIFLDGDTKVDVDFYKEMKNCIISDPTVALYLGQIMSVSNSHIFSASRANEYAYGQEITKIGQDNFGVVYVAPGCASMYRCVVLAKLKIDHKTLAEDMDLTIQVHRIGGKVRYAPKAAVHTQDPGTFKDYHKQVLRWYRGFWQVMKKHQVFTRRHKQRIDWYMLMLVIDATVFSRLLWLVGIGLINPKVMPIAFGIDIAIAFAISIFGAVRTHRWDVIWKFPLYYWLSYVNFYAFARAGIEIMILRKELLAWNKVKRYDFSA